MVHHSLTAGDVFCPSCGKYVDSLVSVTGWCEPCSGITERVCVRCHKKFKSGTPDFICVPCSHKDYDDIEVLLFHGFSLTRAKEIIAIQNRAYCLSCGDYMPRALKGRHLFCTKRPECRKASRRLKYYREMLGMDYTEAFTQVLVTIAESRTKESEDLGSNEDRDKAA